MNTAVIDGGPSLRVVSETALKAAARFWFVVAVAGQMIFAVAVATFYGRATVRGDWKAWGRYVTHGFEPGDATGNAALVLHVSSAVFIIASGVIQLMPWVRRRAPAFHRWNGRLYLLTALTISAAGLYIVWFRGSIGDLGQHLGISLNAVLIVVCASFALRHAIARNIAVHRRWALRLFLVVSGVWFFRIGLMAWLIVNHGPVGFDMKTFQGPFLTFLAFAQTLLPLAVLELYLRTRDGAGVSGHFAMATGLVVLTFATALGIFGATMGIFLPAILERPPSF